MFLHIPSLAPVAFLNNDLWEVLVVPRWPPFTPSSSHPPLLASHFPAPHFPHTQARIEDLISEHLKEELRVLGEEELGLALHAFVEKDEKVR